MRLLEHTFMEVMHPIKFDNEIGPTFATCLWVESRCVRDHFTLKNNITGKSGGSCVIDAGILIKMDERNLVNF